MEKLSKTDLVRMVEVQRDKISRYESRLGDVVAAYKSLSKEKEALEASLHALTSTPHQSFTQETTHALLESSTPENATQSDQGISKGGVMEKPLNMPEDSQSKVKVTEHPPNEETEGRGAVENNELNKEKILATEQLRLQLATLTNSLSTLSAEKSRMEAGFQADKRKLREEKEERENLMRKLKDQNKAQERQYKSELEALKSKLIVERHEREKEHNDHGAMIMELQKLLSEERNSKEQLESSVSLLKSRVSMSDQTAKQLEEANKELEAIKVKLQITEKSAQEASPILFQLQAEMSQLKQQHTQAIQEEQKRTIDAEERARYLAAAHEERVANLESRLAELSETVGSYDRLRQSDQIAIQKLKEHIVQLNASVYSTNDSKSEKDEASVEVDPSIKIQTLLNQLSRIKEEILEVNYFSEKPIDIEDAILANFKDFSHFRCDQHIVCRQEKDKLMQELEQVKSLKLHSSIYQARNREGAEAETLKFQVRSLQERVRMLNSQLEQMESTERELRAQAHRYQQQLETEKAAWQEKVLALESELRTRALQTEQQLALQRERSLALLEDKEQEIRTLKSSFEIFLPSGNSNGLLGTGLKSDTTVPKSKTEAGSSSPVPTTEQHLSGSLSGILLSTLHSATGAPGDGAGESPHILHYAHELARREVDISSLRKARNKVENDLRDMMKILAAERERHGDETLRLREAVARLERCQSREGANLEYLKNVVLSFLESTSPSSKRHMLNAIAAVLRFSEEEIDRVSRHSSNSWWYNSP